MKRIHITEDAYERLYEGIYTQGGSEVNPKDFQAGSDFPCWYDEKSDTWYEASWNDDRGYPFGYWRLGQYGETKFYVGEAWSIHIDPCGQAAKEYCDSILDESFEEESSNLLYKLEELLDMVREGEYTYDSEGEMLVANDGSEEISIEDWSYDNEEGYLSASIIKDFALQALEDDTLPTSYDVYQDLNKFYGVDEYDFNSEEGINRALSDIAGTNFQYFFENGYGMGRIWPDLGMMSFYASEQPDPDTLDGILNDLTEFPEIGESYEDLLDYMIIFFDADNDYQVTGCTTADYMSGNYGPNAEDTDRERTYGDGNTQFIPHLASAEEKKRLGVFKDFQASRDNKWAPRLKGFNGNMAAYRAARYPYTDNKKIIGNIIQEIIESIIDKKNEQPN